MSAYICNPEHVGALAAWAFRTGRMRCSLGVSDYQHVRDLAGQLMGANIASVAYRYPTAGDGHRPGPVGFTDVELVKAAEISAAFYYSVPPKLLPADIVAMVRCLEYQSCEREDWRTSDAREILEKIYRLAVCEIISSLPPQLQGKVVWDFEDEKAAHWQSSGAA